MAPHLNERTTRVRRKTITYFLKQKVKKLFRYRKRIPTSVVCSKHWKQGYNVGHFTVTRDKSINTRTCTISAAALPYSEDEILQINLYFIRYTETDIKTPELKAILSSISCACRKTLDNSYFRFMYVVYRALQKDWDLLSKEREKHQERTQPRAEEKKIDTELTQSAPTEHKITTKRTNHTLSEQKIITKTTKTAADTNKKCPMTEQNNPSPTVFRQKEKQLLIERPVTIPIFAGHMQYLFEVTGKNFSDFSKKNDCLVALYNSDDVLRNACSDRPQYGRDVETKVRLRCKRESWKKLSDELCRLGKEIQTQREKEWCKEKGADYEVWKELFGDDSNPKPVYSNNQSVKNGSNPKNPPKRHSKTVFQKPGLLYCSHVVPERNASWSVQNIPGRLKKVKEKMRKQKLIFIQNGRVSRKRDFQDQTEHTQRNDISEPTHSRKENKSCRSYPEESLFDFKDFRSDWCEKKRRKDIQKGGRKEHASAKRLQGGHCFYCLKPFESLKSESDDSDCKYHPGFLASNSMGWSCCGKHAFNSTSKHKQHITSGCTRGRHLWHPGRKQRD